MKFILTLLSAFLFASFVPIQAQDQKVFRFGIMSDIQYCDCEPTGTRLYRGVPEKLRSALDTLGQENIDFLLNLGDVIDKYWASFDTILPLLDSAPFDVYHILGNHDFYDLTPEQMDSLTIKLNMPSRYYTFKQNNWRFIMLDANEISTYAYQEGSEEYDFFAEYILNIEEVNGKGWNGGILSSQLQWLKKLLEEADKLGEFVIVAGHSNIYPLNMNTMLNYQEVATILEAHNSVKLYVNGHWHDGAYVLNNDLHYLTVKALLDYPDSTAFSVVDITDNEIIIKGYGREPDRILPYYSDYEITVDNGTGGGTHRQGSTVNVSATPPSTDKKFSHWTGDVSLLGSVTDSSVSFTMPAFDVHLTANFGSVDVKQDMFSGLKLFPNPVSHHLQIENTKNVKKVEISDISGLLLKVDYPRAAKFSVDFSRFKSGMFFVRITDERGHILNKRVTKH